MSWQAYVDSNLLGSGKVSKAAIIGLKGGVWATSTGFTLSTEEQKAIVNGFNNSDAVLGSGVRLGGEKFLAVRADQRSIYGKKQLDGAVLVKTTQAVIVTVYLAPIQAGEATPVVEGLADYLISVGY